MPVRPLPPQPSLDHLKYQAKDLLKAHAARTLSAAQLIREFHPRFSGFPDSAIFAAEFKLSDAQLAIARESGFLSWTRLKMHIETRPQGEGTALPLQDRIQDEDFRRAVALIDCGDEAGLRAHLRRHPYLVHQHVEFEGRNYFCKPALLEFIAENPIRHGTMPQNVVALAKMILDAGAERSAMNETLGLVCSGCISRECGKQLALIDLLCDRGADPDSAMLPAIGHGEFEAALALIAHGAAITLPVAAALGRLDDVRRLLPRAAADERHRALALACQFARVEAVRLVLDAGQDPNRYNPLGSHSHSTPLHQAALTGNLALVRLLVERGARADIKDVLWKGTPADWAQHEGKTEVEAYLRPLESEDRKRE